MDDREAQFAATINRAARLTSALDEMIVQLSDVKVALKRNKWFNYGLAAVLVSVVFVGAKANQDNCQLQNDQARRTHQLWEGTVALAVDPVQTPIERERTEQFLALLDETFPTRDCGLLW